MELPEDVLGLVREFSKPVFKHFRIYNHALKVVGRSEWIELKEMLQKDERIVPEILAYLDAYVSKQDAQQQLDDYCKENHIDLFIDTSMNRTDRDIYTTLYYHYWEKRAIKRQCSNLLFKRMYEIE